MRAYGKTEDRLTEEIKETKYTRTLFWEEDVSKELTFLNDNLRVSL